VPILAALALIDPQHHAPGVDVAHLQGDDLQVEWPRTSASSASRRAGKTITGSAASQGTITGTSRLNFRLVMPRRLRHLRPRIQLCDAQSLDERGVVVLRRLFETLPRTPRSTLAADAAHSIPVVGHSLSFLSLAIRNAVGPEADCYAGAGGNRRYTAG
jgi:hypothetical protein